MLARIASALNPVVGGIVGFLGLPGIALAGALAWQYVRYEGLPIIGGGKIERIENERDDWKRASQGWKTAHAKLIAKYETELAEARAERDDAISDYNNAARRADSALHEAVDYRRAAGNYARRMRITVKQGQPLPTDSGGVPPSDNGPGKPGDTEFVLITRKQFDGFVVNTERLKRGHGFFLDLEAQGRAVRTTELPSPEFGLHAPVP